jgi:hypothetical protein
LKKLALVALALLGPLALLALGLFLISQGGFFAVLGFPMVIAVFALLFMARPRLREDSKDAGDRGGDWGM